MDHPTASAGEERIIREFRAAITCKHGHAIAPACAQDCRRPNWLDCLVRSDGTEQRTVGDVVRKFIASGKIPSVEVIERYLRGETAKERRKSYRKYALIAGLSVASGTLLYEGGKLLLRLWVERHRER